MARVTGIGGVFFKSSRNREALAEWYQKNLGMDLAEFGGSVLNWQDDKASDNGLTVWHLADNDSEWFSPSSSTFMINYRIDDMNGMIEQLSAAGIDLLSGPEVHENGAFAWILDPEGNKIELWEPKLWEDFSEDG